MILLQCARNFHQSVLAALFDRLRALRKQLAAAEGVPAYIVFIDAVLRHMARAKPRSRHELLQVPGIGPVKLERYGDAFLDQLQPGVIEPPPHDVF